MTKKEIRREIKKARKEIKKTILAFKGFVFGEEDEWQTKNFSLDSHLNYHNGKIWGHYMSLSKEGISITFYKDQDPNKEGCSNRGEAVRKFFPLSLEEKTLLCKNIRVILGFEEQTEWNLEDFWQIY